MAIQFSLGSMPTNLKSIQVYLDVATDYETTDLSVSYWSRIYALQQGFTLSKSKEDLVFLLELMEWIGGKKEELKSLKTVSDLVIAQGHVENVAHNLLNWAESGFQLFSINQFNSIIVGAFFSAKLLLDVCSIFGELNEDLAKKKKFADLHVANMKNCTSFFNTKAIPETLTSFKQESKPHFVTSETNDRSPEGKKTYDRLFLLDLRKNPSSMKLPVGLLTQEVVRVEQSFDSLKRPENDNRKPWNGAHSKKQREIWCTNEADSQVFVKQVTEMLDDLTPSKWEKLLPRIKCLKMNNGKRFSEVVNLIYDKVVEEPSLSPLYAKLCRTLSFRKVACASSRTGTINFRTVLLARVMKEFEKACASLTGINNKEEVKGTESDVKVLKNHCGELEKNGRKDEFVNIRFIGELFKVKMVPIPVMHECIVWLLSQTEDDKALECICSVLAAIGKELEIANGKPIANPKNVEATSSYYNTLEDIADNAKISDHVRNQIRDVIDLRKSGWLSPCNDNGSIETEQGHGRCEEQKSKNHLSFKKSTKFIGNVVVDTVQNSEGIGHAKPDAELILEASMDFDQQMIIPAGTGVEVSRREQEPATQSNIEVNSEETEDTESIGGQRRVEVSRREQEPATQSNIEFNSEKTEDTEFIGGQRRENGPLIREDMKTHHEIDAIQHESMTEKSNHIAFQQRLKQYLRNATQSTTDDVCFWIQKEYVGEDYSTFIRALITGIIETSVEGCGMENKLNRAVFKQQVQVLRRYVDKAADGEIQVLYAVQALLNKRQHNEGLIHSVFETLYNNGLISEASVQSWMSAADPNQDSEEMHENVKSLEIAILFMTWLSEVVVEID